MFISWPMRYVRSSVTQSLDQLLYYCMLPTMVIAHIYATVAARAGMGLAVELGVFAITLCLAIVICKYSLTYSSRHTCKTTPTEEYRDWRVVVVSCIMCAIYAVPLYFSVGAFVGCAEAIIDSVFIGNGNRSLLLAAYLCGGGVVALLIGLVLRRIVLIEVTEERLYQGSSERGHS
jgi:hypothetical protein